MESIEYFEDKYLKKYHGNLSWPAAVYTIITKHRKTPVISQLDIYKHHEKLLIQMTGSVAKHIKSGIRFTMQTLLRCGTHIRVQKGKYIPTQKVINIKTFFSKTRGQSAIALRWLKIIEDYGGIQLRTAINGGEYRLYRDDNPKRYYQFDGYYQDSNTKIKCVYEFHGCMWHGCPIHTKPNKYHPIKKNMTNKQVYTETLLREDYIRSKGYKLIVMWECDFIKALNLGVSPFKYHLENSALSSRLQLISCKEITT